MAKAKVSKQAAPKKAAKAPAKPKSKPVAAGNIEKVCDEALKKLQALGIEQQLQSEIEWCLGSYRFDQNPSGLYHMVERALAVFKAESAKKTKGVTAKLISDLEKVLEK